MGSEMCIRDRLRSDSVRAMGSIEVIGSTVNKSSVAATGLCKPIFVAVVDEANHAIAARGGQLCSERASRAGRVERSLFGGGVSRVFGHWARGRELARRTSARGGAAQSLFAQITTQYKRCTSDPR